jgi:hypothetical protein
MRKSTYVVWELTQRFEATRLFLEKKVKMPLNLFETTKYVFGLVSIPENPML